MNLVKLITDQLSGDALGNLSSLLGADRQATERAATAAVPSLLSALAGMASSNDGANKLTSVLGGLDASSLGNVTQLLSGDSGPLLDKGTTLLGSLFSNSMISGLANSVSRFSGLNASLVKTLLGYLSPLVLGNVAAQWKNQGGGVQALKSMFADQKNNIAGALPAGFSLADFAEDDDRPRAQAYAPETRRVEPVAKRSPASWAIPLGLAVLGGFLLWQFLRPRGGDVADVRPARPGNEVVARKPELPDVTADVADLAGLRDDLGGLFQSMETTLADIRDPATAERALPALRDISGKIDAMTERLSDLPQASQDALRPVIEKQAEILGERADAISSIEGLGSQITSLIQEIIAKIAHWVSAGVR